MSYAILRTAKLSTWGNIGGSAGHTYREDGMAPNADPARAGLNRTLVGTSGEVLADVRKRFDAVTDKPRSNGVKCVELFLGTSPEWAVGKSDEQIQAWAKANVSWLNATFGKSNVTHAVLHRDETTPHIVAYVVPEVGGRMSAREILGGRDKLAAMQTAYADAMKPFGLERGVQGSKARHRAVKTFYADVNRLGAAASQHLARLGEPTPPPVVPFLASRAAREAAVGEWASKERERTGKVIKLAAGAFLAASTAREDAADLRKVNAMATRDVEVLRSLVTETQEKLELTKDQVAALRRVDVTLVAQRLGHMGEVLPRENAIDLVKRVASFNFDQAVAWLHHELGPVQAGAAVIASLQDKPPPRPFTPAENIIKRHIQRQTDGLGCDRFRLTLLPSDETKKPYLPGKSQGKESPERFYSRADIMEIIPWLRLRNNQGDNILVTPMDDAAYYVFLDDSRLSEAELEGMGFQPCLIQRSSWESTQVVFKVPKNLPREDVIEVFNMLNRDHGDPEITGLRHPIRLAGFRNMKPKHEQDGAHPFVHIIRATNRFCTKCIALIQATVTSPELLGPRPR